MLVMGVFGYLLRKCALDPAPLVLGPVVAPTLELSFRQSLTMSSCDFSIFLRRPISATLLVIAAVLLAHAVATLLTRRRDGRRKLVEAETGEHVKP